MSMKNQLTIPAIGAVPSEELNNVPIDDNDKIIYTSDTGEQYIDVNGKRIPVTNIKVFEYPITPIIMSTLSLTPEDNGKLIVLKKYGRSNTSSMYIFNYNKEIATDPLLDVCQLIPLMGQKCDRSSIKSNIKNKVFMIVSFGRQLVKISDLLFQLSLDDNTYLIKLHIEISIDGSKVTVVCESTGLIDNRFHIGYNADTLSLILYYEDPSDGSGSPSTIYKEVSIDIIKNNQFYTYFTQVDKKHSETDLDLGLSKFTEIPITVIKTPSVDGGGNNNSGLNVLSCGTKIMNPSYDRDAKSWTGNSIDLFTITLDNTNSIEMSKYIGDLYVTASARASIGYEDRIQSTPNSISDVIIPVIITQRLGSTSDVTFVATIDLPSIDAFLNDHDMLVPITISYMIAEPPVA